MGLATQTVQLNGAVKTIIVAADGSGNEAAAHVNVNSSGAEVGISGNPLAVSAAALPLPAGAATAALQPALNGDGGALSHVTNFPATQPVSGTVTANAGTGTMAVSASSLPLPAGAATAALQPAIDADGGAQVHVQNFPATQPVSLASLPTLPAGSNTIGAVTGSGTFSVAGSAAAGSPPVNPPLSVSGVDGIGNKQHLLTNTAGRLQVDIISGSTPTSTAGSPNAAVVSVQGVSGGTVVPITENGVQGVTSTSIAGRGVILVVTVAGNVDFTFADASTLSNVPVGVGLNFLPFSVTAVAASGTGGATFTARGAK